MGEDSGTIGPAKTWFIHRRGCKNHKNGVSGTGPKKKQVQNPSPGCLLGALWCPLGSLGASLGSLGAPLVSLGRLLGSLWALLARPGASFWWVRFRKRASGVSGACLFVPRATFRSPGKHSKLISTQMLSQLDNDFDHFLEKFTDCSTVFEAFSDTSRRQRFFGVGGSGRSPLECTTSEI